MQNDGMDMRKYMNLLEGEDTQESKKQVKESKRQLNESHNLYDIWEMVGNAVYAAPEQNKEQLGQALQEYMETYSSSMNQMPPHMRELFRTLMEAVDITPSMENVYW